MDRREFLWKSAMAGAALALGPGALLREESAYGAVAGVLSGVQVIDAHAHPDMNYKGNRWKDITSGYRYMQEGGMAAGSFSAVGDWIYRRKNAGDSAYRSTCEQIEWWLDGIVKEGKVKLVRKVADIPKSGGGGTPPGAFLSIEGADALEGRLDKLDDFHGMGVRMITLIHYRNNELGDVMKPWPNKDPGPYRGGLSEFGAKVVARMEKLGMVVDVAHAESRTFRDILSAVTKPVIDSHTNPCPRDHDCGRMRTWKEMEMVARAGGVTCTWPVAYKSLPRKTVGDWAKEILEMKRNLGIEHVGLGTDGGGYLSDTVAGYHDERDIGNLANAMLEVGLSKEDIAAYMGGNVLRVMKACMG